VVPLTYVQDYRYVAVQGEYAFVSRQALGLSLINISDPNNPVLVSSTGQVVTPLEDPREVVVSGNRVLTVSPGGTAYGGIIGYTTTP
jgi:hypothetical protein